MRSRAALTAVAEEWHVLAIVLSGNSGVRRTSNSISEARRSFARASLLLALAPSDAASTAASEARSLLHFKQNWPSSVRIQVSGRGLR
jgi:hypothetical protein